MFVHDNGKVSVLSVTRCGHTSMYDYFGIPRYTLTGVRLFTWYNTNSTKVIVLRHPIERMYSAHKTIIEIRKQSEQEFYHHCFQYLRMCLLYSNFKIIHFKKLGNYIPISKYTDSTYTNNETGKYIVNEFFTEAELLQECSLYETLMKTKEEITPEEWKELTQ